MKNVTTLSIGSEIGLSERGGLDVGTGLPECSDQEVRPGAGHTAEYSRGDRRTDLQRAMMPITTPMTTT